MQTPSASLKKYNDQNIFAKILRGEISSQKIYENAYALAFYDVFPKAAVHALVVPKEPYVCFDDFINKASDEEISGFFKVVGKTIKLLGIAEDGFRLVSNSGVHGGQEVPHFHMHILGGEKLS